MATCAGTDVDIDSPVLLDALDRVGLTAELGVWDDPSVAWDNFDLVAIRPTWNYAWRRAEFLSRVASLERLLNPYGVLKSSSV